MLGVAVEDEQGVIHVLAVVAMIGRALLVAVGGVVGAVTVKENAPWRPVLAPLRQVEPGQGTGNTMTALAAGAVFQAGQSGLAGQVVTGIGQLAADELEQGVRAEGIGVVLVLVAAGHLENTLPDQLLQAVARAAGVFAPIPEAVGEGGADTQLSINLAKPGQAPIGGETPTVEGSLKGKACQLGEHVSRCGTIGHEYGLRELVLFESLNHNRRGRLFSSSS